MKISYLLAALFIPFAVHAAFSDVSIHHENKAAIDYVQSKGIVSGYPDGTFGPNSSINRAEFTKIIIEALYDSSSGSNCFPDVSDEWFAKYVCYAKTLGMIAGYPDGTFQPGRPVQFVEAAKIIASGFELSGETGTEWFAEFVRGLESQNAIPTSINSFSQELTRAQMAEIIHRLDANLTAKSSKTFADLGGTPKTQTQSYSSGQKYPFTFPLGTDWIDKWNFYVDENPIHKDPEEGINILATLDLKRVERIEEPSGIFPQFLRAHFPKGAGSNFISHFYGKERAGVVARALGNMKPTDEIYMRYYIRFPEGFDFSTEGSLPNVSGATTTSEYGSYGSMFSTGVYWRKSGEIAVSGRFQESTGGSRFTGEKFADDNEWHSIDIHARLNSVPTRRHNGYLEIFYDGETIYMNPGVSFRNRIEDQWDSIGLYATIGTLDTFSVAKEDMYLDLAGFIVSDKPL